AQIAAAFGGATVTDNCSIGLTSTCSVGAETRSFPTRRSSDRWTVTDACGNTGTASQTVSYARDTTSPVIALAAASALGCNPTTEQSAADVGAAATSSTRMRGFAANSSVGAETGSGCSYSTTKS